MSQHFDMEDDFLRLYEQCAAQSMTSIERMYALYKAVEHIVGSEIEGDFAECGVWRGGSVMMMALAAIKFGDRRRKIWLYDTFSGMTPPEAADRQANTGLEAQSVLRENEKNEDNPFWGVCSRERVESNLRLTGYPMENFKFIVGDVQETLPGKAPAQLSLLRLDTDWYRSTKHELESLYPRLSPAGILIIDDYGYWTGAKKAADEYLTEQDKTPFLQRIDFTGRICVKP